MHEGHRQRIYQKLKSEDALFDHEILEMLLFNALPRTNTNPIAHSLLEAFGSIGGVLNASVEELMATEGVGENVALYLRCIGECFRRAGAINAAGVAVLKNYEDFKRFAAMRLRGKREEVLEFYCLEKNGKVKHVSSFTNNEQNRVEIGIEELTRIIATIRPYGMLIAHNHLSGSSQPSASDDFFTAKAQLACSMSNVNFYDHCIYAEGGNIYSYFENGKIDQIKKQVSVDKFIGDIYKNANKK